MSDSSSTRKPDVGPIEQARVFGALAEAQAATENAETEWRAARQRVAEYQAELEHTFSRSRDLFTKQNRGLLGLLTNLSLARESLERAKLAALNAGLEGARLGDQAGKALVGAADEIRNLLARAADALGDHAHAASELERERERRLEELTKAREALSEFAAIVERALSAQARTRSNLATLRQEVELVVDIDAETHRLVTSAKSSSEQLTDALTALSGRGKLSDTTLGELLGPLLAAVVSAKQK